METLDKIQQVHITVQEYTWSVNESNCALRINNQSDQKSDPGT